MDIKNCAAIVSGGGSGMGAATARLLKQHGANVTILDKDAQSATSVAKEIDCLAIDCDITSVESVQNALDTAEKSYGIARICINCAGIVKGKRMITNHAAMPLQEFREIIEVNLLGTFNLMSQTAARMQHLPTLLDTQERGVIITTASIAAFEGQIGQTAYSASKGGIVSLTLTAARELASLGIRVMCIAPGLVDTPMLQHIPAQARQALIDNIPFPRRLAKPEEYATLALHILENAMLNGEVIRLDGALRMQSR
jgi:NAD(P)-dependent dehydrogenase (short-subunit alcohol dehydrogenase family)